MLNMHERRIKLTHARMIFRMNTLTEFYISKDHFELEAYNGSTFAKRKKKNEKKKNC